MKRLALLATALALSACGSKSDREPAPTPTPTDAQPRTLVAADLELGTLGARIEGPQGDAFETVLSAGNREIGKMVSFVACPAGTEECRPAAMPGGTIYTYVHRITLDDVDQDIAAAQAASGPEVIENAPTLFRTTRAASGFNAAVGYSSADALKVLGSADAISITSESGQLVWRLTEGKWRPGGTLTFWWQSTKAPTGPADAYLLEIEGNQAVARGPFPGNEKPVDDNRRR